MKVHLVAPVEMSPALDLADGFAQHVERWSLQTGADTATAGIAGRVAFLLSRATSEGDVCLSLEDAIDHDVQRACALELESVVHPAVDDVAAATLGSLTPTALRALLQFSGVVGTPVSPQACPLILDDDGRLYLHRYFDYERRLAQRLMAALAITMPSERIASLSKHLAAVWPGNARPNGADDEHPVEPDWQKIATALALRGVLTIISGGPGTGKTTTVVNLLACLIAHQPDCRIALTAPTGKAAARMKEAIVQRAGHLPESIRRQLPDESYTVHRLLGITPLSTRFIHNANNQLAIDALVVDEASMLDLALATQLMEAVPRSARIILLGDKDQLAAVESGAVFSELCVDPSLSAPARDELAVLADLTPELIVPPKPVQPSALQDAVVWLTRNFRFASDSGISRLATLINSGDAVATLRWLHAGKDPTVQWVDDAGHELTPETRKRVTGNFAAYVRAVREHPENPALVHREFAAFRVLCAVRQGARGVIAVNRLLEGFVRTQVDGDNARQSPWFCGRPVIISRNDYLRKLFNGDVGITLPDAQGELMVWFPEPDGGFRPIAPVRLSEHETAFALTVHKAQGSEFDEVFVVLPEERSRVLTRELLYTGVTRARERVTVVGGSGALSAAITANTRRRSGLLARLRECKVGTG